MPPTQPVSAPAAHQRLQRLRAAIVVLVLAQALDIWTTYAILSSGGREANPATAYLLRAGGFSVLALTKGGLSALSILAALALDRRGFPQLARPALFAVVAAHVLFVASNVHQLAAWRW